LGHSSIFLSLKCFCPDSWSRKLSKASGNPRLRNCKFVAECPCRERNHRRSATPAVDFLLAQPQPRSPLHFSPIAIADRGFFCLDLSNLPPAGSFNPEPSATAPRCNSQFPYAPITRALARQSRVIRRIRVHQKATRAQHAVGPPLLAALPGSGLNDWGRSHVESKGPLRGQNPRYANRQLTAPGGDAYDNLMKGIS
jgi:hypothetical protein